MKPTQYHWIVNTDCGIEHVETEEQAHEFLQAAIDDARRDAVGAGEWVADLIDWYIAEIKSTVEEIDAVDDAVDYVIADAPTIEAEQGAT